MRRFFIFLGLTIASVGGAFAQQDAQFSYYMYNTLYYNPAFAGVENVTKLTMLHRSQWSFYQSDFGDGGAPSSQVFSFSTPLYKYKSGVGAHIVHDQLGPLNNLEFQVSGAYHLAIQQSKLSLGFRAGFFSQTMNFNLYRWQNEQDPLNKVGSHTQIRPDMAIGALLVNEKYYAGISFNHLLKSSFDFGENVVRNALSSHMYINGGYYYNINTLARLEGSTIIQTDFKQYNFTLGAIVTLTDRGMDKMWGGLTFRQSEDIGVLLGYHFLKDKSLKFGYSFGYIVKNQAAKEPTSHEFILMYELPPIGPVLRKAQHTPRFRH